METNLMNDIRKGLEEKRTNVCEGCKMDEASLGSKPGCSAPPARD